MPFAVFRQHQRKLLATLAILAMGGFVLSDTVPRWVNSGGRSNNDYEVATLFDRPVRRSDLTDMDRERAIANQFMAGLQGGPQFFGPNKQEDLIDALILQHEADRLEIPATPDFAKRWIDKLMQGRMNDMLFRVVLSRFNGQPISSDQILTALARQIRIQLAQQEVAIPLVTPLDVYQHYRDQTERASFKAVPFVVDSFVGKVAEPSEAEVQKLYDEGKDLLPDPARITPGFKVPRRIRVEFVAADAAALARSIREKLPEPDLVEYYNGRQKDFPMDGQELPIDLFLGEPNLTPPRYLPLSEIREGLADALSRDRANEQISDLFEKVSTEVIDPFADTYHDAEDEIRDAKREGRSAAGIALPKPKGDELQVAATKYGLQYEASPLMDQGEAGQFGKISRATVGTGAGTRGKDFDHAMFEAKLFDGKEFGDILGDRYLVRKLADEPAHVAPLADIRDRVVRAWKVAKARPLARKAADDYAARLKAEGGVIRTLTVEDRPVLTIDETTKLKPGMLIPPADPTDFRNFQRLPATQTEIRQIPEAGPALLDALFALNPGEVAVAPDRPESAFYVMALDNRKGAPLTALMASGGYQSFRSEASTEMMTRSLAAGLKRLREEAHYRETKVGTLLEEGQADRLD